MVWTRETGILDMASELRIWPPIWNAVRGRVAMMMSLLGRRIPFFKTGKAFLTAALRFASHERKTHQKETSKNCMTVKVTGLGRAVRMALEEVLVRIEVPYQNPQSMTNFKDTGAFKAWAISCAFSLMLALRVLTVLMASDKLFCLPGRVSLNLPFEAHEAQLFAVESLLAGHLSLECSPGGRPFGSGRGLGPRDMSSPSSTPSCSKGSVKSGNFSGCEEEERRRSSSEVACGVMVSWANMK